MIRRLIIGLICGSFLNVNCSSFAAPDKVKSEPKQTAPAKSDNAKNAMKNAGDVVGKEVKSAGQALNNTMHDMGNKSTKTGKATNNIGASMKNAGDVVGKEVKSAGQALKNTMHDMGDKSTKTGKATNNIGTSMKNAGDVVGKELKSAEDALGNSAKKAGQSMENADQKKKQK